MLSVEAVRVAFGGADVVAGVDLVVPDGHVTCLLGPSGCGKTTLLRAVAGLQPVDAGRVTWDGDDLEPVPVHRRGFGLTFQDDALFPHRDVAGNVSFALRMRRWSVADQAARVAEVLGLVGLAGFERRAVAGLSGGEQQRVALARALAAAPRLLMLDEPLGSLDRPLRERLVSELRALFSELGLTVLYVTHDRDEAVAVADTIAVMSDGRIEQHGAPSDLWERPASVFVARFLGLGTLVDARVEGSTAVTPWGPVPVPAGSPQGERRLMVRPTAFRPVPPTSPGALVRGVVAGRAFRVRGALLDVRDDHGRHLDVAVTWRPVPEPGEPICLAIDASEVMVLER